MAKFAGKVVIVTGASSGIGAATAEAFAKERAKLAICGRNKERLEEVAKKCRGCGGCQVLEMVCDLNETKSLQEIVSKTVETFDGIDVLVNNAGMGIFVPVKQYSIEDYDLSFNANTRAAFFLSQYALPHLKKTKGCIINVSSQVSRTPLPGCVAYGMTKAALDYFTRGFASECLAYGVRVNGLNCGIVDTMIRSRQGVPSEVEEAFSAKQGLGILQPAQMAEAILFICSSFHMTGSCVLLDGGLEVGLNAM